MTRSIKRKNFVGYRKHFNKTQRDVAMAMGVTESHIRHIENGRANPDVKLLFKLSRYFGTTAENLFPDLINFEVEFAGNKKVVSSPIDSIHRQLN
ncbi:helix-turn-helix transcriptional regulator [Brevibacillus brevis]|uniref:helix-turn-helix transcriptional regulator n=1 Tax=Brevibacillus brevis TaxID=1393 RepID=UPI00115B9087|nr:helix-turn-helix transcriptional regulator [Lysinibacillus sp. SDF0063]TQR33995.1 XRE family transcriptional regulator [Lysinibacillus sp. SDF0063]